MNRFATATAWGALLVALIANARAQDTTTRAKAPDDLKTRDAVNQHYDKNQDDARQEFIKQQDEIEGQRIDALAALAAHQDKDEAVTTYRQIFHHAIARDQYDPAARAADQLLKSDQGDLSLRSLATFIKVVAQANRGDDDAALAALKSFLSRDDPSRKLDARTIFAVGGAFLERLIDSGRYDSARKAASMFLEGNADPDVKTHFESRRARLDMLGKAAPPIATTDVDGEPIRLADLKGKVVLIDFWATWCSPCVSNTPELNSLYDQYHARGFEIIGVNVDGAREGNDDPASVRSTVRRFLIDFNVPWVTILNGDGDQDFTKPYGVSEIPAHFLVGRDGTIIQVEQTGESLDKCIKDALGPEQKADPSQ
ncbi:MAG: TlpA disulfide reductase family protein [Isosphaeraceae bacterium]